MLIDQLRKLIESALTTGVTPLLIKAINVVVMGLIGVLLYQVSLPLLPLLCALMQRLLA